MTRLALIGLVAVAGCGTRLTAYNTTLVTAGTTLAERTTDTGNDPGPTPPLCNTHCTTTQGTDSGGTGEGNPGGSGRTGGGSGGSGAGGSGT